MGDSYPKFKVAAVQAAPVFLDREKTTEKACGLIRAAGKEGARVIGFPETYIPGFPHWFDYRIARECKGLIKELFKNSVEIPGPVCAALCEAALADFSEAQRALGQVLIVFVITIAAAELALAVAIILRLYRNRSTVNVDEIDLMKW